MLKKIKWFLFPPLLFAPVRSGALADTVSFSPQKDNTIYLDLNGQLSNGQGIYLFAGRTTNDALRRGLIAFDLTSIPTNATITGATLSMFLNRPRPNDAPVDVSLSRALRDWGEGASDAGDPGGIGAQAETGDATWLHTFYDTSFWTTPGGDFSSTLSATTPVMENAIYTWSGSGLLADVQSWVSNPATNFGWFILGDEVDSGTAQRFNTRENTSDPPQLTVTYQVSSPTPTPTPTSTPTPTATATPALPLRQRSAQSQPQHQRQHRLRRPRHQRRQRPLALLETSRRVCAWKRVTTF